MFDTLSHTLGTLFSATPSLPVQLALSFALGLLLSLTPCIFPLIPITLGILQGKGNNSRLRSFGMAAERITQKEEIDGVLEAAFKSKAPILIEVNTSLDAMLP